MKVTGSELGIVAIGRNEGDRLKRCITSLPSDTAIVYVDSGSTDGTPQWVRAQGISVVDLDMRVGFTAARARNLGLNRLLETVPDIKYVQFLDGDCELVSAWPGAAISFLEKHAETGAFFGRRRERYPDHSVYNWLCDLEWNTPIGESKAFGGDVMLRVSALKVVGGYRNDLVAGEDPELAIRLRAAHWKLFRLDLEMTLHDAAITCFHQWWWRNMRSGYAFALGADLHGAPPERHWVWESRRAWIWGVILPFVCVTAGLLLGGIGLLAWLIYPFQVFRQAMRARGSVRDRLVIAFFQVLSRFPESWGQIKYHFDRAFKRQARIIEYK
jgi:glycosyltransferase involved in cell wall biosynthesis